MLLQAEVVLPGTREPVRVPRALTRAEEFDELVLTVLEALEARLDREDAERLRAIEIGVEEVPPVDEEQRTSRSDLLEEDGVPLALLREARTGRRGTRPARIVLYRRPLVARASDALERGGVVLDVLVEAVARLLGLNPDDVHPEGRADDW